MHLFMQHREAVPIRFMAFVLVKDLALNFKIPLFLSVNLFYFQKPLCICKMCIRQKPAFILLCPRLIIQVLPVCGWRSPQPPRSLSAFFPQSLFFPPILGAKLICVSPCYFAALLSLDSALISNQRHSLHKAATH